MDSLIDQGTAWEKVHSKNAWLTIPTMEFLAFMAESYWGKSDLKFLDLGAGAGSNTLFIADKGFEVTAVEISKSACDRIYETVPDHNKSLVKIVNVDALEVDFPPNSFDCVIAVGFFECLSLEQSCLIGERLKKWLKPGGQILVKVLAEKLPLEMDQWGVDIRIYTGIELVNMIFKDFDGPLRIDTRYISDKLLPVTNWTFYPQHKKI